MLEQLRHKNTWIRTLKYFVVFAIFYSIVKYLFKDGDREFFSFETFTNIIGFSLVMSIIFLFTLGAKMKTEPADDEPVVYDRSFKYYAGFFLFLSLILVIVGIVLLLIGFAVFKIFSDETISTTDFLKPIAVFIAMALLMTIYAFFSDRLKRKRP